MPAVNDTGNTSVVIVGGGAAGWMTAAALTRYFNDGRRSITVVESDAIGIIGVGEATIPPIRNFNGMLDIPENEFLRETRGTFKLGIEFVNWGRPGDRYFHPFGGHGQDLHGIAFHQLFLRERARVGAGDIADYSMSSAAAAARRFGRPGAGAQPPLNELNYAFHFDAGLYAAYLRRLAERQGAIRREGRIVGVERDAATRLLAPYLKHRTTGRPWVVLKLAATVDGRTAAPDGSSQWITSDAARADAHRLRAESDAVLVGAGTVRADDPSLTVRLAEGADPRRVVLGRAPEGARVHPATEVEGDLGEILDGLCGDGVVQVLVEGGAAVAHAFHTARLVDRYVLYLAPALFGGDDGRPVFAGAGAPSIDDVWRGRLVSVAQLGDDLRVELEAA